MSDARTFWKKHVAGWRASGETAKQYSERHGLATTSLWSWSSRLKREGEVADVAMRWARVKVGTTAPRPIMIRVHDVHIAVERGFDTDTLAAIFAVIERRPA